MSQEQEDVSFALEVDVSKTMTEIRRLEILLFRSIGLLRRLGLPEDIEQGIVRIQRLIMAVRLAHAALIAMQAAAGPIGWALAGVGIVSAAWTAYDVISVEAEMASRTGDY